MQMIFMAWQRGLKDAPQKNKKCSSRCVVLCCAHYEYKFESY